MSCTVQILKTPEANCDFDYIKNTFDSNVTFAGLFVLVSEDESYNEAAHTLLTIGNLAHLSQSAQNQTAIQDHTTG